MIIRKNTKQIFIGSVPVGGGADISIQSMTTADTRDADATLTQICALHRAGCEIVRVAVFDMDCAKALKAILYQTPVPIVADVHFDHRLAVAAIREGVHKLRLNPGNIREKDKIREVARCAKDYGIPIRVGANSGSVHESLIKKYGGPTPKALVQSVLDELELLARCDFHDCVVAIKASNVQDTVEANALLSEAVDYPVHIGITEAGGGRMGLIKGVAGIGALLLRGIGDTLRFSLTGDPAEEVIAGRDLLQALGIRQFGVDIVSCPTCGRCRVDIESIAGAVAARTRDIAAPLRAAVMGCVVNGPGEAREADAGIACGDGKGVLFIRGERVRSVPEGEMVDALVKTLHDLAREA